MKLTLYYAPRTRSFAALWMLEELGQKYQLKSFDIESGRHKKPDYLALNPMGKVPLVLNDDVPVSELGAIAIYLSDAYPKAQLCPTMEEPLRSDYLRWIFFSSAIMEPAFVQKMYKWDIPAKSIAWGSFDQMLDVVTKAVSESKWLVGDSFSSADILVGSTLRFGQMLGVIPKKGAVQEYISRLKKREAFIRAEEIETTESARFPSKK